MLKSHFRGSGIQFKEHQVYNPGDDVRFIDWKLSAKTNTTYIKTFEEDRNVEIFVLLDITATMFMGYKNVSKMQAAIEIICLLYLLAEKTKDQITVVLLNDDKVILPKSIGHRGMAMLISQLEKINIVNDSGKINNLWDSDEVLSDEKKISFLKSLVGRRKEVIYLSDFSSINDWETFEKLCYRPNMHCFKIMSPLDEKTELPFSIFAKSNKKKKNIKILSKNPQDTFEGRYKKLNVKDRYLDKFVREML